MLEVLYREDVLMDTKIYLIFSPIKNQTLLENDDRDSASVFPNALIFSEIIRKQQDTILSTTSRSFL